MLDLVDVTLGARNQHDPFIRQFTPAETAIEQTNIGQGPLEVGDALGRNLQASGLLQIQGADIERVVVQEPLKTVFNCQPVEHRLRGVGAYLAIYAAVQQAVYLQLYTKRLREVLQHFP